MNPSALPTLPPGAGTWLLALDPSTTVFGYAIFHPTGWLYDAGKLTPRRARDEANDRIDHMLGLAGELMTPHPEGWTVVVEDTSGKVNRGRHGGAGAGLAIYGKAVGAAIWWLRARGRFVVPVLENEWTGSVSKAVRQRRVAARHRAYDPAKDAGGDVSDAIGLGEWWLTIGRHRQARAVPGVRVSVPAEGHGAA
jgi:hypothetical protein